MEAKVAAKLEVDLVALVLPKAHRRLELRQARLARRQRVDEEEPQRPEVVVDAAVE